MPVDFTASRRPPRARSPAPKRPADDTKAIKDEPIRKDRLKNRTAILNAASRVFATEGFLVPLDRIAETAGVGRATLYRNFASRAELAFAILEQNVSDFEALGREIPETPHGFRRLFEALAETIAAHAGVGQSFGALEGEEALVPLRDRMVDVLDRHRLAGIAAGDLRAGLSREDMLLVLATLGGGLAIGDFEHRLAQARRMVDLIFEGLSTS